MNTQIVNLTAQDNALRFRPGVTVLALCDASDGAFTVTLPDAENQGGSDIVLLKTDSSSNAVTVATRNSQTINGSSTESLAEQYKQVTLRSDRSNYLKISSSTTFERGYCISVVSSDQDVATGDGNEAFTIPSALNGLSLSTVIASVHTKGITGTTDVQVRRRRAGVDADMLSTKVTIGDEYYAADGVVNSGNAEVATGDQIYIDVDAVHSGTAPTGLSVTVVFE